MVAAVEEVMPPLDAAVTTVEIKPKSRPLTQLIEQENRRRRRRRIITWTLLALVPLLLAMGWYELRPKPVPMAARFRTQQVTRGDVVRVVHATGHVDAVTTVQVGAEISGRIKTVEVDYNDHVAVGQVLARFDRAALEAQLAQITALVTASRATLDQAKIEASQADRNLARAEALYKQKAISDTDHENAVSSASLARERVEAAQSQVAAQQAAYSLAKTNLDHTVIVSPIDGVVITRNVDPGQTVASVFQTPVLFSVAADLRQMEVVAAVDEADIGEVALGQRATFTVNAYADRVFEGKVTEVRNSPVIVQDVVTYGTVIMTDNKDLALKPGMTASARIETASVRDALRVPAAALRFNPPGEAPRPAHGVWMLDGVTLKRTDVKSGVSDGELTEIQTGVLTAGTPVLVDLTPEGRKAYDLTH